MLSKAIFKAGLYKIPSLNNKKTSIILKRNIFFESLPSITQIIQNSLIDFHNSTGLPWWSTFSVTTILVRISLFPLVRLQINNSTKLNHAMPEIFKIYNFYIGSLKTIQNDTQRRQLLKLFYEQCRDSFKNQNVSLSAQLLYPIFNITILITFIISLRGLIVSPISHELAVGGMSWFLDLTDKDITYTLPFLAVMSSYTALSYSFYNTTNKFGLIISDTLHCILLICLPFYIELPCSIYCYWIPSSLYSILQTKIVRTEYFQKLFTIDVMKPPLTNNNGTQIQQSQDTIELQDNQSQNNENIEKK